MVTPNFSWFYVLGGIIFSSLAQIFLKRATSFELLETSWILYVSSSAFSYLISFVAYYMALRQFSISKISPVMTVGVVLIVVCYGMWVGETLSTKQYLGILLGIISLVLILS